VNVVMEKINFLPLPGVESSMLRHERRVLMVDKATNMVLSPTDLASTVSSRLMLSQLTLFCFCVDNYFHEYYILASCCTVLFNKF
jgi:hypothetical protein